MSQDGQFLHYIFPYQFLDSPEWESLQPSEEGIFQVIRSPVAAPPRPPNITGSTQHRRLPGSHLHFDHHQTVVLRVGGAMTSAFCGRSVPELPSLGNREGAVLVPDSHSLPTNLINTNAYRLKKKKKKAILRRVTLTLALAGCSSSPPGSCGSFQLCQSPAPHPLTLLLPPSL